jgi:hypothetical protein
VRPTNREQRCTVNLERCSVADDATPHRQRVAHRQLELVRDDISIGALLRRKLNYSPRSPRIEPETAAGHVGAVFAVAHQMASVRAASRDCITAFHPRTIAVSHHSVYRIIRTTWLHPRHKSTE